MKWPAWLNNEVLGNSISSYIMFASILVLGLLFYRLFSRLFSRLLYKVFEKYSTGVGAERFVELIRKPFAWFILLVIFYLSFDRLCFPNDWHLVSEERFGLRQVIYKSYQILVVISVTRIFLRIADFIGLVLAHKASLTETKTDDMLVPFVKESIKIILIVFSVLFILGAIFNLNITSIIAGLGIGGLAFALAAKETLENLLGSFTIFLDKPFQVGDTVQFGNTTGTVERIGFRSTRLRTLEKSYLTVPNKKLVDAELDNLSLRLERRVKQQFHLGPDSSAQSVKNAIKGIEESLKRHPLVSPEFKVRYYDINQFGDEFLLEYYITQTDYDTYLLVRQEMNLEIKQIFEKEGLMFVVAADYVKHGKK